MTLRTRLTLGLIFLATTGLVITDAVSYTSLRTFLLDQVDSSLTSAFHSLTTTLPVAKTQGVSPATITTYEGGIIPGYCVQLRQLTGRVISSRCLPQYQQTSFRPSPRYPAHLSLPSGASLGAGAGVRYFTVPAVTGGGHYRVASSIEHGHPDYVLLIATPLTGVDGTLHRLLVIELAVTAGVLALLACLGLWVVGLGLRPLAAIGDTARAIARGDLTRRVDQLDGKTEIGQLGQLLNTMLGQIEAAFQAREASEQTLRRFVADASHELRTPVAAVRAYAELFSLGAVERPDDLERSIQGLQQASERMSALVDELFLLAHLDEGRPLATEPVDLESVVSESLEVARALEPERPLVVETRPTMVIGDRSRLRQLVDNLLGNVRAHTPPATPANVSLEHVGANAVLSVSDLGPGIDHATLPHVFERFYRAEITHARVGGGSGLGLAIVAAIAEAHAGTATVKSEPGQGTTFTVVLPLAAIESGEDAVGSPGSADAEPEQDEERARTVRTSGRPQDFLNLGR